MRQTGVIALARARSQNAKLGDASTTYAAQVSCPTTCAFFDGGGCYAETGQLGKFVTSPLNDAASTRGASAMDVALAEAVAIQSMESSRPLRLHTVGDCATDEAARVVSAAAEDYMARGGGPVWTYTHAWRTVARESWGKVSVLASCETPMDVELARARGYAPSIVVEEFNSAKLYKIEAATDSTASAAAVDRVSAGGLDVLPCPAQTHEGIGCTDCRLCFDDGKLKQRGYAIGFEIHGIPFAIRQARQALRNPDDPHRRLTAEQRIRLELKTNAFLTGKQAAQMFTMNAGYANLLIAHIRDGAEHPSKARRKRYDRKKRAERMAA